MDKLSFPSSNTLKFSDEHLDRADFLLETQWADTSQMKERSMSFAGMFIVQFQVKLARKLALNGGSFKPDRIKWFN